MNAEMKALVAAAEANKACAKGMERVRGFDTVEAFLASPNGPVLAMWYATRVLKARWPKAEAAIRRDAGCWKVYSAAVGL